MLIRRKPYFQENIENSMEISRRNAFADTNVAVFPTNSRKLNNFNKIPQATHSKRVYPQIFPQQTEPLGQKRVGEFMRMMLKTPVLGDYQKVFAGFDQSLLLKLTPPGMKMELLHSDPSDLPGGKIKLKVTILGLIRQEWENVFSDYALGDQECHFVDTGKTMPFPIRFWRHNHRVQKFGENALILDDIEYKCSFFLLDWLLYPILWMQFKYRKPIYQRHFGKP